MSPDKQTDTQSVLDQLVKGVTDRKTPLTPIGEEATGPRYAADAPKEPLFAADVASMIAQLHYIQDAAQMLLSIADRLEKELTTNALAGTIPEKGNKVKTMLVTEKQKATPAEPERDFAAEFAAKAAAAQAATFTNTDAKAEGLWLCPTHGSASERTSKKGRKYRACDECSEFERA